MKRPDLSSDSFGECLLCIILRAVYNQDDDLFLKYFYLSGICTANILLQQINHLDSDSIGKSWGTQRRVVCLFVEGRCLRGGSTNHGTKEKTHKNPTKKHHLLRGSVGAPRATRLYVLISPSTLNPYIVNFLFN